MTLTRIRIFPALAAFAGVLFISGCDRPEPVAPEPEPTAPEPAVEESSGYAIPALPAPGFDLERYSRDLQTLASDEFEGRAPGSRGERLTVNYLVEQLADAGLQPGFGDSYLQSVPMVELTNQERSAISVAQGDDSFELTYPDQMIIGSRRLGTRPGPGR